jgi:hypothetical protein
LRAKCGQKPYQVASGLIVWNQPSNLKVAPMNPILSSIGYEVQGAAFQEDATASKEPASE